MAHLPDWQDSKAITDWTNRMLDAEDYRDYNDERPFAPYLGKAKVRSLSDLAENAIECAERGNIAPLHELLPRLKPFLFPPKLKKGSRFPPSPFLVYGRGIDVSMARKDVWRIRLLWKHSYNKRNRPYGDSCNAISIAAKRNNLKVEVLENAIKNSSRVNGTKKDVVSNIRG